VLVNPQEAAMTIRSPERERKNHAGWEAELETQADPMLKMSEPRPASPLSIAIAAAFGLIVVVTVLFGLNQERGPNTATVASGSSESAPTTSGSAPPATDANAPSPADKAATNAQGESSGQSSAIQQPANQGQGDRPGRSGDSR
jgi:hypothetical protein